MKRIKLSFILISLLFFSTSLYSQLWKQYADSAKIFIVQKNLEKEIEFYSKEKDELKKDSSLTYTYTKICDNLATIYTNKYEFQKAELLYLEAKKIKEKVSGKANADYANSCSNLGRLYHIAGKYQKAETLYLEAKEIRRAVLGKEHADYAMSCDNLGLLYENMGQYEKAGPLLIEATAIRVKVLGKENADYAQSCNNLGLFYEYIGQYEKAEPLLIDAKSIREKVLGNEHQDYASSCDNLANLYFLMSQYQKAEPLYLEAKDIRAKVLGREHRDYATSCNNLASLYQNIGQYEKAEALYLESMGIRAKVEGKEHPDYAKSCSNLGVIYQAMGQHEKAEQLYLEAKDIRAKVLGKEHPDYANSCNNLAVLYTIMGQYEKSEPLYLESMKIRAKVYGKEHPDYALGCDNLAILYMNMGQYEKAEPLCLEAKRIRAKVLGKETPAYANSCYSLGNLYSYMSQDKKAESFFLEAMEIQKNVLGKEHPDYGKSCLAIGALYINVGENEKAEPLIIESNEIIGRKLGRENEDYASSISFLGYIYMNMGQNEKAKPLLIEAKIIQEKLSGNLNQTYTEYCNNLGNLYWNLGNIGKAYEYYSEAWYSQQAQVQKIFQFTSEVEKYSYLKRRTSTNIFFFVLHSVYERGRLSFAYDVSLSLRNMLLSSTQQLREVFYTTHDTAMLNRYNVWSETKIQLARWYTKPINQRTEEVKLLEERANDMEKELTRSSLAFNDLQQKKIITWKNIQQKLKSNEAAIEFVDFSFHYDKKQTSDSNYYIALLLRKDKPEPELIKLFEKKQLDSILIKNGNDENENITSLYAPSENRNQSSDRSIYDLIWKPMEKSLKGITKIYFAPSGNLHTIAFAALPIGNNKVLSDKYQLIELNTTASVTNQVPSFINTTDNINLYGGIKYDADSIELKLSAKLSTSSKDNIASRSVPDDLERGGSFNYLPGTEAEVESIKSESEKINNHVNILSGVNATEESFKSLNGKASPAIIHIATHGFFFPDPKEKKDKTLARFATSGQVFKHSDNPLFRSGLLFAGANYAWKGKAVEGIEDGILTAYEVSNMYLPNTKLVVLSACETALGDIQGSEGVYGLQRAFKIAGVQNLVMSLWKVPDAETSEFMQLFYKNLFARESISDAFYNSQTIMKNKYRTEPYKWAAWVLLR